MSLPIVPGPNNQLITGSLPTRYGFTSNYVQSDTGSVTIASSSTTPASVVNVSITTTGNPVFVSCTGDANPATGGGWCVFQLYRGSTAIGKKVQAESSDSNENVPYGITCIDNPPAGTYTYSLKVTSIAGSNFTFGEPDGPNLTVFEIR
jgi:hypothetical protein